MLVALLFAPGFASAGETSTNREYEIKAAFLYNFSKFIEWPETEGAEDSNPFVIGILGDDPFAGSLDKDVSGRKLGSRPFEIQRFKDPGEVECCHILFIRCSADTDLPSLYLNLANTPTLTVCDRPCQGDSGCHIVFDLKRNKVTFTVNRTALEKAGLKASSKILKIATEVR